MHDLFEQLKKIPILAGLPDSELDSLCASAKTRHYAKNTIIFSQGDESSSLYLVLSGRVRVYMDDEQGRQIIINTLSSNDYFGELALLSNSLRSANVMTIEPCSMAIIHKQQFLTVLENDMGVAKSIIHNLVERVQELTNDISSLALQDVYSRLARFITEHAKQLGDKKVVDKVTHQEIADTIGSSREMVSRILADLKTGGYIEYESRQIILLKKLPSAW